MESKKVWLTFRGEGGGKCKSGGLTQSVMLSTRASMQGDNIRGV